ncbi:MAG: hypothetical protein JXA35_08080, partial [Deltaproteobacteria bacterium]|nr:hypothetical protein [Deltaproteobacteria bacterium]
AVPNRKQTVNSNRLSYLKYLARIVPKGRLANGGDGNRWLGLRCCCSGGEYSDSSSLIFNAFCVKYP